MKMHEHDQDIIMALAEGSLDPEALARAEAAISSCDECRTELELQRLALTALRDAPAVYLSASESAQLHDRLHRELGVTSPQTARSRLRPVWSRWAALAAGTAAVLVAAFLVLPNVLGGDDAADTVAFEQIEDDFGGSDEERSATTAAAAEAPSAAAPSDDAADMGMALEDSATATTAVPETTASADMAGDGTSLSYFVEGELTEELRLEVVEQLTRNGGAFVDSDAAAKRAEPGWAECVTTLFGPDSMAEGVTPQILGSIVDDLGVERLLVALVTEAEPMDTIVVSVTLPECEIFEFLPEGQL